ncbi:hypothetical protein CHLRE_13g568672v5 [Chlamydomonas reinhardtii]|uniref:Uncharacterized protein n=1 Tax=Chlamydomonas reinhardtii TaxID=3055 RepID=A0A2K3CZI2_CHLRE|nr:uncharacterized protein CHLRE_13g568672v5 [Chlamydomonas reinhardtii]PNW73692.1 hypothetical protein CHLRE_13g568672v5 [Chlamydomonas reinhardtii]
MVTKAAQPVLPVCSTYITDSAFLTVAGSQVDVDGAPTADGAAQASRLPRQQAASWPRRCTAVHARQTTQRRVAAGATRRGQRPPGAGGGHAAVLYG